MSYQLFICTLEPLTAKQNFFLQGIGAHCHGCGPCWLSDEELAEVFPANHKDMREKRDQQDGFDFYGEKKDLMQVLWALAESCESQKITVIGFNIYPIEDEEEETVEEVPSELN